MPSPFPGMNPFLEQPDVWQDFHQSFMKEIRDQLVAMVRSAYIVKLETHIEKSSYVEIRDKSNRTLITVIELISPTNKYSGPDREAYLAKRKNLLNGQVNYVEMDLLRGGPRLPIPDMPASDYLVFVRRTVDWPVAGLWPLNLHDPLPMIPIPLQAPDGDLRLDLQQALHKVYDAAGYEYYIYNAEPEPGLSSEDAAWARQFLPRQAGFS